MAILCMPSISIVVVSRRMGQTSMLTGFERKKGKQTSTPGRMRKAGKTHISYLLRPSPYSKNPPKGE